MLTTHVSPPQVVSEYAGAPATSKETVTTAAAMIERVAEEVFMGPFVVSMVTPIALIALRLIWLVAGGWRLMATGPRLLQSLP